MTSGAIQVVAGVLVRDGRILICQRRKGDPHELKWEFPGGKVEPGEEPRTALVRELREELAIEAEIGPEMLRYEFQYPGKKAILLIFFPVRRFAGEPKNLVFAATKWERPERLPDYDFLDGDIDFVNRLAQGEFTL